MKSEVFGSIYLTVVNDGIYYLKQLPVEQVIPLSRSISGNFFP